jgi:hypothetical protein
MFSAWPSFRRRRAHEAIGPTEAGQLRKCDGGPRVEPVPTTKAQRGPRLKRRTVRLPGERRAGRSPGGAQPGFVLAATADPLRVT